MIDQINRIVIRIINVTNKKKPRTVFYVFLFHKQCILNQQCDLKQVLKKTKSEWNFGLLKVGNDELNDL